MAKYRSSVLRPTPQMGKYSRHSWDVNKRPMKMFHSLILSGEFGTWYVGEERAASIHRSVRRVDWVLLCWQSEGWLWRESQTWHDGKCESTRESGNGWLMRVIATERVASSQIDLLCRQKGWPMGLLAVIYHETSRILCFTRCIIFLFSWFMDHYCIIYYHTVLLLLYCTIYIIHGWLKLSFGSDSKTHKHKMRTTTRTAAVRGQQPTHRISLYLPLFPACLW